MKKRFGLLGLLLLGATLIFAAPAGNVLVVINDANKYSAAIGLHYAKLREVPEANICHINCNDSSLSLKEYNELLLPEVKNHLSGIAYIVMSYGTPITLNLNNVTYSLDAFLCFPFDPIGALEPFKVTGNSESGYLGERNPFYTAGGHFSANGRSFMVTRLDGPTAEIANELVERALYGEKYITKKYGRAYIDSRGLTKSNSGYYELDKDIVDSAEYVKAAGFETTLDIFEGEFDNKCCADALWYFGWYKYNNYNDAFYWKVGAVGIHFDSASALGIRGTKCWSGGALAKGITATGGCVNEPYGQTYTRANLFMKYLMQGYNFAESCYMATPTAKWMMTFIGDPLYTPSKSAGLKDTALPEIKKIELVKGSDNPDTFWRVLVESDKFVRVKAEYAGAGADAKEKETDSFFKKAKLNMPDLTPDTEYKVKITVTDSSGNTASKEASFKTTPPVPEQVKSFTAQKLDRGIDLVWTASAAEDVTGYLLFRSVIGGGAEPEKIADLKKDAVSFQDRGLANSTTYCYNIRAVNKNGELSPSCEVFAAPTDLAAVTGVKTEFKLNALKISWEPVKSAGVSGYQVYRHVRKKGNYKKVKYTEESSVTDFEPKAGQTYYYKITTIGKGKQEGESTDPIEVKIEK